MIRKSQFSRWIGLFGSVFEHHDKALFVLLAPFISRQYFPADDLISSVVEIYGVIVLSLLVRPLAALYFGPLADKKGRKAALLISMLGMSATTIGVGLLPSYDVLSWGAPLLLFLLRCGQNFFGAGELTGGAVYVLEHTEFKFKPLIASLFEASVMVGILLASLETTLLAYLDVLETHWHWLFLFAGALGLFGVLLRSIADETPEYEQNEGGLSRLGWKEIFKERKTLLVIALTSGFSYGTYILSITFVNAFLKILSPMDALELTSINSTLIFIDLAALPLFGLLSLYFPPRYLMSFAAISTGVLVVPLFAWMSMAKTLTAIILVRLVIVILGVCFAAPYRAWIQGLVNVSQRCTLLNLGGTIGQLLAEGPLTLLSLMFLERDMPIMPAVLLALFGFSAVWAIRSFSPKEDLDLASSNL